MNYILLVFILIPIIVHLFDLRKTKKIFFSNINLINSVTVNTKRKSRIKQIFILTTRLLSILSLLIFLFLLIETSFNVESKISIFIDNSVSQSSSVDGSTNVVTIKSILQQSYDDNFEYNSLIPNGPSYYLGQGYLNELEVEAYTYSPINFNNIFLFLKDKSANERLIFSDFQDVDNSLIDQISADSTSNYKLIINDISKYSNAFIDTLILSDYRLLNDKNPDLSAYFNSSTNLDLLTKVYNVDQLLSTFSVPINSSKSNFTLENIGSFVMEITGDELIFDNQFYFTINDFSEISIVIISEGNDNSLNRVYEKKWFNVSSVSNSNIDYEVIDKSDLIILNELTEIPVGLNSFENKKYIIIPKDSIVSRSYEVFIGKDLFFTDEKETRKINIKNNLLSGIYDTNPNDVAEPEATRLYSLAQFDEMIMEFNQGDVFLSRLNDKYVFSSPLEGEYSNIKFHPIFLPMMYELAFSVLLNSNKLYYRPNDLILLDNIGDLEIPIKIVGKEYSVVPEFLRSDEGVTIKTPISIKPGIYHLLQASDTLLEFSVNLPKSESLTSIVSEKKLNDMFGQLNNVEVISIEDFSSNRNDEVVRLIDTHWKIALIITLLFLLIESILHRIYK